MAGEKQTIDVELNPSGYNLGLNVGTRYRVSAPLTVEVGGRYDRWRDWVKHQTCIAREELAVTPEAGRPRRQSVENIIRHR